MLDSKLNKLQSMFQTIMLTPLLFYKCFGTRNKEVNIAYMNLMPVILLFMQLIERL